MAANDCLACPGSTAQPKSGSGKQTLGSLLTDTKETTLPKTAIVACWWPDQTANSAA